MKKQILQRGALGALIGIVLGDVITVGISLCIGQGEYFPCVPAFVSAMGNQLNAVMMQMLLDAILGAAFGASSLIWEIDKWSIAKQTGVYFFITAMVMMPIAYFANWMHHSFWGMVSYFAIFAGIFVVVWISQYLGWKRRVKKLNDKLK
ncbi:MAG: DUF3021 domain-containing protein [Oscillospiraceae bacterium]|nr:DUF3021 domain-containing protein [Oscillospiraceae bacterium]